MSQTMANASVESKIPAELVKRRRLGRSLPKLALQVGVVLAFLAIWQLVSSTKLIDPFYVSSPIDVARRVWEFRNQAGPTGATASIWTHIWVTFKEAILGFALGVVIGVLVGVALGQWRLLADALYPLLNLANTLPRVALGPLFILWFGIDEGSKVFLVFTVVVFIMIFNTYGGTQTVDRDLIASTRLLGATPVQLLRKITLPSCLPWIFAGMRISLAWSLGAAVIGEYLGARNGVGYLIFYFSGNLDNEGLLAGCVVLLLMSFVMFGVLALVERRLLRWRPST